MQFTISLLSFFCATIGMVSAIPTGETIRTTPNQTTTDPICTPIEQAVPLFRLYAASIIDHFYTASSAEVEHVTTVQGFVLESTTGLVFPTQVPGTVPLHRLYNSTTFDHFYTTTLNPSTIQGYEVFGIDGYIYPDERCGAVPWFRLHNSIVADHIYTTSVVERDNAARANYVFEGIAGYVLPSN
ncbi:hypothetical protein D9756_002977 [Leucocoprinus leucothites]|uniref:DUF5648 domain-containing protein n=1 Tax=Leucocoprinus leucothites TaxID=201217 RepID=A0A8H5LJI5_9AGAR|nr:hypothetical protein D9756_002977 [Leucoagaricus leucothites]